MKMRSRLFSVATILSVMSLYVPITAFAENFTITFDDLPTLSSTDQSLSFTDANGGSSTLHGVTFTNNFEVTGDDYRIKEAPSPPFGLPHSGHYFLNNGNTPNNDLIMTTTNVLTEAWFGRTEYYGYGGGASSVTVTAFGTGGDLRSITINLPDTFPCTANLPPPFDTIGNGLPDPMAPMDVGAFLGLAGITGYRISRVEIGSDAGNWVADDFTFTTPLATPEPGSLTLIIVGLVGFAYHRRHKNLVHSNVSDH